MTNERQLLRHLRLMSHKLNYLQAHFPRVKRLCLEAPENKCTEDGVNRVVEKVTDEFGTMKVKLVVGSELFVKSQAEVDMVIQNGRHIQETEPFIEKIEQKEKKKRKRKEEEVKTKEKARERDRKSKKRRRSRSAEKKKDKNKKKHQRQSSSSSSSSGSPSPKTKSKEKKNMKKSKRSKSRSLSPKKKSYKKDRSQITVPKPASPQPNKNKSNDLLPKKLITPPKSQQREKSYSSSPSPIPKKSSAKTPPITTPTSLKQARTRQPSQKKIEDRVRKFQKEENSMLRELEVEKSRYYERPSSHPSYQAEWVTFWRRQQQEAAVTNVSGEEQKKMVEAKWMVYWKNFFDTSHEAKMQERRQRLMALNMVTAKDIEEVRLREVQVEGGKGQADVITLDSSEDEMDTVRSHIVSPCDSGVVSPSSELRKSRSRRSTSRGQRPGVAVAAEDATLLATLRLLASLDTAGCLGDGLTTKLGQLQEDALTLEGQSWGSSEGLVRERQCSSLLDQARERLAQRLEQGRVGPGHREAARLALANLQVLLARRGVEREEVLEIDAVGGEEAAIRRRVEQEVAAAGRRVSTRELEALVEAEVVRARLCLPSTPVATPAIPGLYSAYPPPIDWAALTTIFPNMTQPQPRQDLLASPTFAPTEVAAPSTSTAPTLAPHTTRMPDIKAEAIDELTEAEVVQLVRNFKQLDKEDQKELIAYMKKLEKSNPERVNRLKMELHLR